MLLLCWFCMLPKGVTFRSGCFSHASRKAPLVLTGWLVGWLTAYYVILQGFQMKRCHSFLKPPKEQHLNPAATHSYRFQSLLTSDRKRRSLTTSSATKLTISSVSHGATIRHSQFLPPIQDTGYLKRVNIFVTILSKVTPRSAHVSAWLCTVSPTSTSSWYVSLLSIYLWYVQSEKRLRFISLMQQENTDNVEINSPTYISCLSSHCIEWNVYLLPGGRPRHF